MDLFERLVIISAEAVQAKRFEVAYYATAAAMHAAAADRDVSELEWLRMMIRAHEAAIEAEMPPHRFSSARARRRGTRSIYSTLQATLESLRRQIRSEALRQARQKPINRETLAAKSPLRLVSRSTARGERKT
jgi:hypothetical protein